MLAPSAMLRSFPASRITLSLALVAVLVALAFAPAARGADDVISRVLSEARPSVWWEKHRDALCERDPRAPVQLLGDPALVTAAAPLDLSPVWHSLASRELLPAMTPTLHALKPRRGDPEYAQHARDFLLVALDKDAHDALGLPALYALADTKAQETYDELRILIESPAGLEAFVIAKQEGDAPTPATIVRNVRERMTSKVDSAVKDGFDAAVVVASELAALATACRAKLGEHKQAFTRCEVPTDGADMPDLVYLLVSRLGDWNPSIVDLGPELERAAERLEGNLAAYMAHIRDKGKYPSKPWGEFYVAVTKDMGVAEKAATQMLLKDVLVDLALVKRRYDEAYVTAFPTLRAAATYLNVVLQRAESYRLYPHTLEPAQTLLGGKLTLPAAIVDCLMVMRFCNDDNRREFNQYFGDPDIPFNPNDPNTRQVILCQLTPEQARAQTLEVLRDAARRVPAQLEMFVRRALDDEAELRATGKLPENDLGALYYWLPRYRSLSLYLSVGYTRALAILLTDVYQLALAVNEGIVCRMPRLPRLDEGAVVDGGDSDPDAGDTGTTAPTAPPTDPKYDDGYALPDPVVTPTFYGIPIKGKRICFVLDSSGSMGGNSGYMPPGLRTSTPGKMDVAKYELLRAIENFKEDVSFNVVMFADDVRSWADRLMPATEDNIAEARTYIVTQAGGGNTNMWAGLELAFRYRDLDTIVLLSDGQPTAGSRVTGSSVRSGVADLNRGRGVRIHCIDLAGAAAARGADTLLKLLAEDNGGIHIVP